MSSKGLGGLLSLRLFCSEVCTFKKMKEKRSRILNVAAKSSGQCLPRLFPRTANFCGHSSILLAAWHYQLPPAHGSSVDPFCSWKWIFLRDFVTFKNWFCSVGGSGACGLAERMLFPGSSIHFWLILLAEGAVWHLAVMPCDAHGGSWACKALSWVATSRLSSGGDNVINVPCFKCWKKACEGTCTLVLCKHFPFTALLTPVKWLSAAVCIYSRQLLVCPQATSTPWKCSFGGEFLALLSRAKIPVCEMRAGWHLRPGCRAWRGAEARVRLVVPPQPLEHLVGNMKPWIVFKKLL